MKIHQLPRASFLALVARLGGAAGWPARNHGPTDNFDGTVCFSNTASGLVAWEPRTLHGHYFFVAAEEVRWDIFPTRCLVDTLLTPGPGWQRAGEVEFLARDLATFPPVPMTEPIVERKPESSYGQHWLKTPLATVAWTERDGIYLGRWWEARHPRAAALLLGQALSQAQGRGCREARTWVARDNAASLAIHEAMGFRPTGVTWPRWRKTET